MKKYLAMLSLVLLFSVQPVFSQDNNQTAVDKFISKYLVIGSPDYNNENAMFEELRTFNPADKTKLNKMIRKRNIEEYKLGIRDKGLYSDEEYNKAVQLDALFSIAEDIALEKYDKNLMDLGDDDVNAIMKESNAHYAGDIQLLQTGCVYYPFPASHSKNDPGSQNIYFASGITRVTNDPAGGMAL